MNYNFKSIKWGWFISALGALSAIISVFVFATGKQTIKDYLPKNNIPNISGEWEMIFSYKTCSNPKLALSGIELYYDLQIDQDESKIKAAGIKKSEKQPNKKPMYYGESGRANVHIQGEITNGHLIGKVFEINSKNEELRGDIDIDLANGHFIYDGKYRGGSEKDCDGIIKLRRKA